MQQVTKPVILDETGQEIVTVLEEIRDNITSPPDVEDMISDAYSITSTYDVGDYCIYNNTLYKCNTAITTPEAFNPSKWTVTTVVNEFSELGSGQSLTQAEYDALTPAQKSDGTVYYITDAISTEESELWSRVGRGTLHTDAQVISNAVNELKGSIDTNTEAISELESSLALQIKSNSADITTNSNGSGVITNSGTTFIIQVHLNSIGNNSYIYRLGQSGNVTYLHLMDELGNPITNKTVNITWLYIDFH